MKPGVLPTSLSVSRVIIWVLVLFGAMDCGWAASYIAVNETSPTMYIEPLSDLPNSGNPTGWVALGYDTSQDNGKGDLGNGDHSGNWQAGIHGVGYGDSDDQTSIVNDVSVYSVYTRSTFSVANAGAIQAMTLEVDYDDAYVMWLNGTEIARSAGATTAIPHWNSLSTVSHEVVYGWGVPIDLTAYVSALHTGTNVLAIGCWNVTANSTDMTLRPRLTLYDAPVTPEPLHVYLTWQGDTSTTMTVNYQTGAVAGNSRVYYDTVPHNGDLGSYAVQTSGAAHTIPGLNTYTQRNVHVVQLTGLTGGQTYYFVAGDPAVAVSREMKFRTIPSGDAEIRFFVGGDIDIINPAVVASLHRQGAMRYAMFGLMTGDLAIDNGLLSNWARWDTWLDLWEDNAVTPDGCQVPMVLATGNHEVDGGFGQTIDKAPFYFGYFAQEPGLAHFARRFGNNLDLIVLNSGHVETVASQVSWLSSELSSAASMPYRFATYHVPCYPSDRALTDTNIIDVRTNWLPVFDQYGLSAAFEGHDHAEKRTMPIKGDAPNRDGTVYFGDGYATQGLRPGVQMGAPYLEHLESKYHLWFVDVPSSCVPGASPTFTAIDENGVAFDTYTKKTPGTPATIVPTGSTWKYLVTATDPGTTWKDTAFIDSAWPSGPAQLGYGDGDEATVVGYGPDPNNKYPTTYFRKSFTVADRTLYSGLRFRILRDDGAVVYLNGVEVFRSGMPTGAIAYATLSNITVSGTDETTFFLSPADTLNYLTNGTNVLAVEIHQVNTATSTDISFDLELQGYPGSITSLLPTGSMWKYLVTATDPGSTWKTPGFADGAWPSGLAQLGYGDSDEATVLTWGTDSANKYPTTYFRTTFNVADKNRYRAFGLRLLHDDGAVVYLNGAEVFRATMATGIPVYTTWATVAIAGVDETTFFPSPILSSYLVNGTNTLAVEIHQNVGNSSDISLDLELLGITGKNTITAAAGTGGAIAPNGVVAVDDGGSQVFNITPSLGYHVADVQVGCTSVGAVSSYAFTGVTGPNTIAASFALDTYTVSGTVTAGGLPLEGVTLNGLPGNPVTNASGVYTAFVNYGWSGSATPSLTGYNFTPPSRTYTGVAGDQPAQDYVAALNTYTITGSVKVGGDALVGVTISGLPGNPVTNASGVYTAFVTYGWSGTATPALTGYTFVPANRTYANVTADQSTQDYAATLNTYSISGTVMASGVPLAGVTINGLPGTPVTNASGVYTATVTYGWSGTATPIITGYAFAPASLSYADISSDQSAQDYSATPNPYAISGTVLLSGLPLAGVTLNGLPGNPVTNASGVYTATVGYGWSGVVSPSLTGHAFVPASRTYSSVAGDVSGQDYTATLSAYTISGTVTRGGSPLPGVTLNGLPGSPVTNSSGVYTAFVTYGWSGSATPTLTGYTFTLANRTYTNVSGNQSGQDFAATLNSYTITGTIAVGSTPLAGVTLNGLPGASVTNASGVYVSTIIHGWSGTATPTRAGYTFEPVNRTYTNASGNQTGQDYTATLNTYTISGTVTVSGSPLANVTMNGLPGSPVTDPGGLYSATVDYGWSGTATPSQIGYTFIPDNRSYASVANSATGQDYATIVITYPIAASAGPGGSIAPNGTVPVNYSGSQVFAVTADPGYHVLDVLVDGSSVGAQASYQFDDVLGPHTIAASFEIDPPDPLAIATQPAPNIELAEGASIDLVVSVTGGLGTIHYHWYKEDAQHVRTDAGGDSPTLSLAEVSVADEGTYTCEISDDLTTLWTTGTVVTLQTALPLRVFVIGLLMFVATLSAGVYFQLRRVARL